MWLEYAGYFCEAVGVTVIIVAVFLAVCLTVDFFHTMSANAYDAAQGIERIETLLNKGKEENDA